MTKGIAGYVATTGSILNIPNAYDDERFNREVDILTGYTTKTILCMPINIRGSVIGVVQMVNKLTGVFTKDDEESFEMFAVYCGLALHQAKLYEKVRRSEQKYKVALDVLSYHNQATEEEVQQICAKEVPQDIPELILYDFSPWSVMMEEQPLYVIYMFKQLLGNASRYSDLTLVKFTLTVRKNYRPVPYHNWAHAFSVAHAVYTVLMTSTHKFTPFESMALFVACLCHDMDHRGKTNAFMVKSSTPLAAIYSTSTMEHHHFNQTIAIMQNEGHNVFEYLTSDQYKQVLGDIKHCILATDLALFFGNQAKLKGLSGEAQFNWQEKDHRHLVMANCMTASDLCSMYKPWSIQEKLVYVIMEEFWQQGDLEKAAGQNPRPMMDRSNQHKLPLLEVGFLVGICLPCYEVLAQMLPQTQPMVDGAKANLKIWQDLAEKQQQEDIQEEMEQEVEAEQTSINVT
ncbi:putative 3',5'-cyclic phosphodiesterase pde-5 [Lamellibrachia satsuma]|nr:putative 3',5'-cyclic phosphodiesterase pde-5 [Lamellibrachia satsuma]